MDNFKDLNLDQTKLESVIQDYLKLQSITKYSFTEEKNNRKRLSFEQNGKKVIVDFFLLKNGTTTISTNIGPAHELGTNLAVFCKEKLTTDDRKNISVSIKLRDTSIFNLLVDYFKEENEDFVLTQHKDDKTNTLIKITSIKYNDSVSVSYFKTTNTLLLQGKPLFTYYQISYFLSEYADVNAFFDIITKFGDTANRDVLKKVDVTSDLDKILENAKQHLGDVLYDLLKTSFIFKFQDIELPEYSCIVFPALRALEGVIRRILFDNGIRVEKNGNKFTNIFHFDRNGKVVMDEDVKLQVDSKIIDPLCKCYKFLNIQRTTLFHINDFTDGSRVIEKKEDAYLIIDKVLTLIEKTYYTIKN